jgi:hypothetical protein
MKKHRGEAKNWLGFSREQRVHVDVATHWNPTMYSTTPIPASHTKVTDREQALRWLIANRRPDITTEQAIRIMRAALPRDAETMRLLHRICEEEAAKESASLHQRLSRGLPPHR